MKIKIVGIGSYTPQKKIINADFVKHIFLNEDGSLYPQSNEITISKFQKITGIVERRYAEDSLCASDLGFFAAKKAIENSDINPETIDYIIVAHNFGDIPFGSNQTDTVPSLATRIKYKLGIKNSNCVAFDILFGCPGWIEGVLIANSFIKSGMAKRCLVIGAETLSRVTDPHDRDSMIYSDGAGAVVIEESNDEAGLLSYENATFAEEESCFLYFGKSYNTKLPSNQRYIKMQGRKIYEFALNQVPLAMKNALDKSGLGIEQVTKILIHQANEKMDEVIVSKFYKLYDKTPPENIMPMTIHELGNSSVATVPTLLDLLVTGKVKDQKISKGDILIFASVGAGMNINAFVYRY